MYMCGCSLAEQQKLTQHCKATVLQLKKKNFKEYPKPGGRNKLVLGSLPGSQPAHAVRERVGEKR